MVYFVPRAKGFRKVVSFRRLLSNIMLHEFDAWMEANYLSKKVRKDRWAWNFGILKQRPIAVRENRQWKPAISYCRYADDFVMVVKGTKAHAEAVREACRTFLEDKLKLTLNMEKTHITHVNDGFVFLGHRIIRKRGPRGRMRPVTTIPWAKYRGFAEKLVKELSGNYSVNRMDMVESLNRNSRDGRTSTNTPTTQQRLYARWIGSSSGSLDTGLRASIGEASES